MSTSPPLRSSPPPQCPPPALPTRPGTGGNCGPMRTAAVWVAGRGVLRPRTRGQRQGCAGPAPAACPAPPDPPSGPWPALLSARHRTGPGRGRPGHWAVAIEEVDGASAGRAYLPPRPAPGAGAACPPRGCRCHHLPTKTLLPTFTTWERWPGPPAAGTGGGPAVPAAAGHGLRPPELVGMERAVKARVRRQPDFHDWCSDPGRSWPAGWSRCPAGAAAAAWAASPAGGRPGARRWRAFLCKREAERSWR